MTLRHQDGPQPTTSEERRAIIDGIAATLQSHFSSDLQALGLYGSAATGTDAPYSDAELHCVVQGSGIETRLEWSTGPWKAEVDVYSRDRILERAGEFECTWPLTHGAFANVSPLFDPEDLFSELRRVVWQHDDGDFRRVVQDLAIGEVYELVAKLRNLRLVGGGPGLTMYAVELGMYSACLVGLINRHLYSTGAMMFSESLQLDARPAGYDALCELLADGALGDVERVCETADSFWRGVEGWSEAEGLVLYEDLTTVLERDRSRGAG